MFSCKKQKIFFFNLVKVELETLLRRGGGNPPEPLGILRNMKLQARARPNQATQPHSRDLTQQ
jgi:hypothetical protein